MEPFKQKISAEGCSSSESGWTMYISSPTQEDDVGYNKENDEYEGIYGEIRRQRPGAKLYEEESDDSMASDASSTPFHYHHTCAHTQNSHGAAVSEKGRKDGVSRCSSRKNTNKMEKKRIEIRSQRK